MSRTPEAVMVEGWSGWLAVSWTAMLTATPVLPSAGMTVAVVRPAVRLRSRVEVAPAVTATGAVAWCGVPGTAAVTSTAAPGRAAVMYAPAADDTPTNGSAAVLTTARTGPAGEEVVPATKPIGPSMR